ncbi:hypothetical protein [Caulobacter sp. LARHSG274]
MTAIAPKPDNGAKRSNIFKSLAASAVAMLALGSSAFAADFANIAFRGPTNGSGHIGVDIYWADHGVNDYNPCHHSNDPYYAACAMSGVGTVSYYKVAHFSGGSNDFPYGIFINNSDPNFCNGQSYCTTSNPVVHGWGNLVNGAAVEVYPYNTNGAYDPATNTLVGLRASISGFGVLANNGRYTEDLGSVTLPQKGAVGVGALNGFVRDHGVLVGQERMKIDAFQESGNITLSTTGRAFYGFSSYHTNGGGYYTTGPVPNGRYKIYLTDTAANKKIILYRDITMDGERLDFELSDTCFGQSPCDPA